VQEVESREPRVGPQRVQKILSAHGVASRRNAEDLIRAGRVTVNGLTAHLGQSAEFGRDEIVVDGKPVVSREKLVYIMLYKPRGYVTTIRDERGRKTVMDLVEDIGIRVFPVGRLDINSEGLLLMTNDGKIANAVAHPSFGKKKTYEVRVRGDAAGAAQKLSGPIMINNHVVQAVSAKLIDYMEDGGLFSITIGEGRNRQIRKMCESCGLEVMYLKRVSIGPLLLGTLKPGKWRHLTGEEVRKLRT